ncbi:MAG: hypothetical protein RBU29_03505 [bacterium]|jgi:tetratricopeptide (TPR) repeat protein|nr:hypothetical protein [bacterium]
MNLFKKISAVLTLSTFLLLPSTAEDLSTLYLQGNAAMAQADYITAAYYFNRMMDAEEWTTYPDPINVLGKLGLIEESQADFLDAARYYGQICDALIQSPTHPQGGLLPYYLQRQADCLERSGFYQKAISIYWQLLQNAQPGSEMSLLSRLIRNYAFLDPTPEEMQTLHDRVIPVYMEQAGWDLADLYRIQEDYEKCKELYNSLWRQFPQEAQQHAESIYQAYTAMGQLDDLLKALHLAHEERRVSGDFLLLEVILLEHANQSEEALQRIETYLSDGLTNPLSSEIPALMGRFTTTLIDKWINLVEKIRGPEAAIPILKELVKQSPLEASRREKLSGLLLSMGKSAEAVKVWLDWIQIQSQNPLALFHAAETINALGDPKTAKDLLAAASQNLPPNLAYNHAYAALRMGDFDAAIASFMIAEVSGGVSAERITLTIDQFTQENPDTPNFIAALLESASESIKAGSERAWVRDGLIQLGITHHAQDELNGLAQTDPSGRWALYIAMEAQKQGKTDWALQLFQSISPDSPFAAAAKYHLAELLSHESGRENQIQAYQILKPAVDYIIHTTDTVTLTPVSVTRLFDFIDTCLSTYQPEEALAAVRRIESASNTLPEPLPSTAQDRLRFARARTMTQLASFGPALQILDQIQQDPYSSPAALLKAKILIGQKKNAEALVLLRQMIGDSTHWRVANDALSLLTQYEPLVGDSQALFADAMLYQLQGRYQDAIPQLRQLAVENFGEDTEEWARFTIGLLENQAGQKETAQSDWQRLALDADHPTIYGMTRYELLHLTQPAHAAVFDSTAVQLFLLDFPQTLFSDLVRLESERMRTSP